jgi:hypothetical protein
MPGQSSLSTRVIEMLSNTLRIGLVAACMGIGQHALAECPLSEKTLQLDPIEVGFCESDAVFVGKVEQIVETIRAYTEEGTDRTKHFDTQRTTIRILDGRKGTLPEKVTMLSELYDKDRAYVFESGKTYLVFAKRLAGEDEYAGANAKCSVQPTLKIEQADSVLKRLEQHQKGSRKIDCKNIHPKENPQ